MKRETVAAIDREVVITRIINAPRELVFKAWTTPAQLAEWWGPKGFTNPECEADVRPGGAYRIVMRGPDGTDYPMNGVYRDVVPPALLVMSDEVADMPQAWIAEVSPTGDKAALASIITVTFEAVGETKTHVVIRTVFQSAQVRDAFARMGMIQGWTESLEKLEVLLAPM